MINPSMPIVGMERATLSGLMANGINEMNNENSNIEVVEVHKSNNGARLNLIVNDLVLVVENQHRIMRDLRKQSGLNIHRNISCGILNNSTEPVPSLSFTGAPEVNELLSDENYCTLLRLVGQSTRQSESMRALQDHFRNDFDINGFQQVSSYHFTSLIQRFMSDDCLQFSQTRQ